MEQVAASFLQKKGFSIIERNYRCKYGEVDIIAESRDHTIIFVEVKARKNLLENAFSSVTTAKQRKILKTATLYLQSHPEVADNLIRFDVVGIIPEKNNCFRIEHLEDAFRGDLLEG